MAAGGEALLLDYPELRPLVLPNARITGRRIGVASHGRMEEVEIPGATCAARKTPNIFQDRPETPEVEISRAMRQFVEECQLMGSLRHPHILQFLGVCFMPGLRFPAMVAERLMISLHELLDPEMVTKSAPRLYIPLALKRSMLHDMARGVAFLHSHAPPIIHRDLSARNVLLDSAMVAKIADLGMARFSPNLRPAMRRNRASEAPVYMPPEALVDELRNDKTIDIFSFGILTIFVLSQTFPRPLSATYMDAKKMIVSRTELERRANYMQQIHSLIHRGHTLITMIELCLDDSSDKRPTIGHILQRLEGAKAEVQDNESDLNKLLLVQNLRQKTQQIRSNEDRIQSLQSSLEAKDKELNTRMEMITSLRSKIVRQEDMIADLQIQLEVRVYVPGILAEIVLHLCTAKLGSPVHQVSCTVLHCCAYWAASVAQLVEPKPKFESWLSVFCLGHCSKCMCMCSDPCFMILLCRGSSLNGCPRRNLPLW